MDEGFKVQSLEAWERLKNLSDEERKRVLTKVQATMAIEGMNLPKEELDVLRKYGKGELSMEQVLESVREWIAQFQEINGEEELKKFLHRTIIEALPR